MSDVNLFRVRQKVKTVFSLHEETPTMSARLTVFDSIFDFVFDMVSAIIAPEPFIGVDINISVK